MPSHYRIDKSLRMIFSSASGVVTDDDLRGHQRALLADPDFDPRFSQLWDCQQVEEVEVSSEALRALAESKSYTAESRRAVVAPHDVVYGLARMFQALHDESPEALRVFRTPAEAKAWLGLT